MYACYIYIFGAMDTLQGGAKNGASLSHCNYSENSMTELR